MTVALLVVAVALAVAVVQGVAGFGFALLAVPAFAFLLPVKDAVVLSTVLGAVNSSVQAVQLRRSIDRIRARRYLIGSFVGAPAGFVVYLTAPPDGLRAIVGAAVLGGTLVMVRTTDGDTARPWLDRSMAFTSGVLLTSTSTNGPPLVLALRAQRVPADAFRATLAVVFALTGAAACLAFALAGQVGAGTLSLAAASTPAVAIGARLGHRARGRVGGATFSRLVVGLLIAGAVSGIAPVVLRSIA